jgi:N-methylhydantoinase B
VQRRPALASKVTGVRLQKGDRVRIESPGGGGYGSPMRRSAAAVRADVDSGYVTREMAARDYGVALDADGLVDEAASAELRRGAT